MRVSYLRSRIKTLPHAGIQNMNEDTQRRILIPKEIDLLIKRRQGKSQL